MLRHRNHQAEEYFNGHFRYSPSIESYIHEDRFETVRSQFALKFDDFYHDYFARNGHAVDANKALLRIAFHLFQSTYGHLPLAYKNCAISSGTWAHLDAVSHNHHTTDRLSRIVGGGWHGRTIKDNSQRSLERIERIKDLFIEVFFIAPTMFEGSTRMLSKEFGQHLTSLPFQAEEYMAFWNMVIDSCESFILDDMRLDTPSIAQVEKEIDLARSYSTQSRGRPLLQTSDWANSRNSIFEMARANYIRFGMHPLRPDATMDMRFYDQSSHRLYPARLIDTLKPVLQNILRWGAQGVATDSACVTAARLIDLHRMRTDSTYNAAQEAPLHLDQLSPLVAKPSMAERKEFAKLIAVFEPILLQYFPHLIKTDGLSLEYKRVQEVHPLNPSDVGDTTVKWQRDNIPKNMILDAWALTLPTDISLQKACRIQPVSHGVYVPPRRQHDFENQPFQIDQKEIWPDHPFDKLDPMFKQLALNHMGVLEIVAQNNDVPEYNGTYRDLKRGDAALLAARNVGVGDLALLPGTLGHKFSRQVRNINLEAANEDIAQARVVKIGKKEKAAPAFGTAIIADVNKAINRERVYFNGPGPHAAPSDYRLGLYMEMLRRNLTTHTFTKNWETSEDEVRLMLLATKIEFGKVNRPGSNHTEIKIWDDEKKIISFADRIKRLHTYLSILKQDPLIKRCIAERAPGVLEKYGIRHISLTLARMIEIYDCLRDQEFNKGRFEVRRLDNLEDFMRGFDQLDPLRSPILSELENQWCWLWAESDLNDLRQEFRDKWLTIHGRQATQSGPKPHMDTGIKHHYGP